MIGYQNFNPFMKTKKLNCKKKIILTAILSKHKYIINTLKYIKTLTYVYKRFQRFSTIVVIVIIVI